MQADFFRHPPQSISFTILVMKSFFLQFIKSSLTKSNQSDFGRFPAIFILYRTSYTTFFFISLWLHITAPIIQQNSQIKCGLVLR